MSNQHKSTPEKKVNKGKRKVDRLAPKKKGDKSKGKMIMNLISHDQIERSLNESSTCYALVAQQAKPKIEVQVAGHIKPILKEFFKVFPKDLPGKFPKCETFNMPLT